MAEVTAMRNNALPYPIYAAPYTVVFPMLDADGDLVTGATTPDAERSLNGDTFADCTNESTEIATSSGMYYLTLTATEMTADIVSVIAKSATAGMKTTPLVLYPRKLVTLASGTSQGGAAGYITLAAGTVTYNNQYNGCICVATIDSVVEARVLQVCTASNQQCTVTPNWNTAPDADDTYVVYLPEGMQIPTANTTLLSGTAQTARDIGASVLLSSGSGAGQLDFTSGVVKSNLVQILGATVTGTAAQIVAAFTKWFNVANPTGTVNSIPDAVAGAASGLALVGSAMTLADDAITASKFDETTAFPLKSADTGATGVARVGADSDTLETLSDQIDGLNDFDPSTDTVLLAAIQGAITWDQQKITANAASEGALHITNVGTDGVGIYADAPAYGIEASGGVIGQYNTADGIGSSGQYNESAGAGGFGLRLVATNAVDPAWAEPGADTAGTTELLTRIPDADPGTVGGLPTVDANNYVAGTLALGTQAKADVNAEVVDVVTTDVIADSIAAHEVRPTMRQALLMIYRFLLERSVSTTTVTVNKEDGSTASYTLTLDDADAPTSITRTT